MSGPGKNGDSYRCDACRHKRNRCTACRLARAKYRRDLRALKVSQGICIDCPEEAIEGQLRCQQHQEENATRSRESHKRRRAKVSAVPLTGRGG